MPGVGEIKLDSQLLRPRRYRDFLQFCVRKWRLGGGSAGALGGAGGVMALRVHFTLKRRVSYTDHVLLVQFLVKNRLWMALGSIGGGIGCLGGVRLTCFCPGLNALGAISHTCIAGGLSKTGIVMRGKPL